MILDIEKLVKSYFKNNKIGNQEYRNYINRLASYKGKTEANEKRYFKNFDLATKKSFEQIIETDTLLKNSLLKIYQSYFGNTGSKVALSTMYSLFRRTFIGYYQTKFSSSKMSFRSFLNGNKGSHSLTGYVHLFQGYNAEILGAQALQIVANKLNINCSIDIITSLNRRHFTI